MAMPPLAFSVHNFISSTGADAGFAAIVGLAILVLLYFTHARETANLREEAALLTQRLQHAEARVAQLTRMQAVGAAEAQSELPALTVAPFAPAGMAAPALASATHLIPVGLEVPEPDEPIVIQRPVAAPVAALAMAGASASSVAAAPRQAPTPPPPAPAVPAPATNAGGNGAADATDRPLPPPRPAMPRRPLPPLEPPPQKGRRSRLRRGVAIAFVAIIAVAIAVVLVAITSVSGPSSGSSGAQTSNSSGAPRSRSGPAFKPASFTVAVLNGTSVNQLAHRTGAKLAALGYKEGRIATAQTQTQTRTVVAYRPGAKNRTAALHVATALGLRRSAVQPVDPSTLQVACPGPATCTASVVVTLGTDLATS